MAETNTRPVDRARIVLQGGGRLEHVVQILDVRLEADPLHVAVDGPARLWVRGGVRAFVYCRTAWGREIEGQGVYIPFSSRIALDAVPAEHAKAAISELHSDYAFDPVTGDFQHEIAIDIAVTDRREAAVPPPPEGPPPLEAGAASTGGRAGANAPGTARGETRLSQVRTGPPPEREEGHLEPVASREPAPGELEALAKALRPGRAPGEESRRERPDGEVHEIRMGEKGEGAIVWGPFPPPIGRRSGGGRATGA